MGAISRQILAAAGVLTVLYAVTVLEFVAISPDLRIRTFLLDDGESRSDGIVIRKTPDLKWKEGLSPPNPGDLLLFVNRKPTLTFIDYFDAIDDLYLVDDRLTDKVNARDDALYWLSVGVGPLLQEIDQEGNPQRRFVEVLFRPSGPDSRVERSWVEVQAVPPGELALSLLWLLPHLGILLVGGAACWQRPFDRSARLFYVTCLVTMAAYIGGFHWWTVANSAWLTFPFVACSVLLPAVTLHFFLIFPRPHSWAVRRPKLLLTCLYALPTVAIAATAVFLFYVKSLESLDSSVDAVLGQKVSVLSTLRSSINAYMAIAAIYYALTLVALMRSTLSVREPLEKAQVRWILGAAISATLPVGYTIWLAATDRASFAFGGAKLPMFFASFGFLLAYAVGMVRHRLLLADEVIGKGLRYYSARIGLMVSVALALSAISLWAGTWDAWLPKSQSTLSVVAVIVLATALLLIARDRLQQELDRHFFSEKYQLGEALRGVHAVADLVTDEFDLGRRVIDSCQGALDVNRVAVYRRTDSAGDQYRLTANSGEFPEEIIVDAAITSTIREGGHIQRILTGSRSDVSPIQDFLRTLSAQLVYAPPASNGVSTLLVLGPKSNESAFTAEDLTFLSALSHVADVAFGVGTHRRLAEQFRMAQEAAAAQSRQVTVLQNELAELHQRQGNSASPIVVEGEFNRDIIRGESPAINEVLQTVRKVAGSDSTVMIRGESGTGKELLSQVIHDNSPRRNQAFIRVHCAALSPTLLESELFGHVKGAFTGADKDKIGRFQLANGGTLFLDEIGEITAETQVKLLRVLQERCFEPVGSSQTMHTDVRVITATNRNLETMIAEGTFREDLYYRLNVISVTLPPLRDRREDIYDLAFTFLYRTARRLGKSITRIDDDALAVLLRYQWPGNIRELQNVIERAVVLADGEAITIADLPRDFAPLRSPGSSLKVLPAPSGRKPAALPENRGRTTVAAPSAVLSAGARDERQDLIEALRSADGNKAEAARILGLPRSTFFSRLKKYDLA